jgi:hypothetical protein
MPKTIPLSYADLLAEHRAALREIAALEAMLRDIRANVPGLAKALAREAYADGNDQLSEISIEGRAAWKALIAALRL